MWWTNHYPPAQWSLHSYKKRNKEGLRKRIERGIQASLSEKKQYEKECTCYASHCAKRRVNNTCICVYNVCVQVIHVYICKKKRTRKENFKTEAYIRYLLVDENAGKNLGKKAVLSTPFNKVSDFWTMLMTHELKNKTSARTRRKSTLKLSKRKQTNLTMYQTDTNKNTCIHSHSSVH